MIHFPSSSDSGVEPVQATLTSTTAAEIDWHCLVVGAGPAGASTALRLARRGRRVLLVDRANMPRPKVCGCCLSTLAVVELRALCASEAIPEGLPLSAVCLTSAGRSVRLPMPGGGVLSRESLDAALVRQAIAAGVDWLPEVLVDALHEESGDGDSSGVMAIVRATNGQPRSPPPIRCRIAVIAAGLSDTVRIAPSHGDTCTTIAATRSSAAARRGRRVTPGSRIGLGATLAVPTADAVGLSAGELCMAVDHRGYCGLVRLEDGRLDLAAAIDGHVLAHGIGAGAAIADLLTMSARSGLGSSGLESLLAALPDAVFRATPSLTHRSPLSAGVARRIFRVGDAAGYVEPFTGEGIGWALAGARILAESLLAAPAVDDAATAAARYAEAHRRLFRRAHGRCRWVARGVRRPAIVSAALGLAQRMPGVAERALPLIVGATNARVAVHPPGTRSHSDTPG